MRVLRWLAATALMFGAAGGVNQRAGIAKDRKFLNDGVPTNVPELARGEELTLEHAILLAHQDNENLMIRGEDFIQAMNDKDRAFAQFLPTISLSPNYTITHNPNAGQTTTSANGVARPVGTSGGFKAAGRTLRRFEVPVVGSGNLFHGFRDLQALEAEDWTVEQRRELMLDAQVTLLLDVADAYYQ